MAGVLAFGAVAGNGLEPATAELLAAARRLAEDSGEPVAVALLGSEVGDAPSEAVSLGADKVYLVQHPLLREAGVDLHLAAAEQLCRQVEPSVILVDRTPLGRDLAPRLGFRLGAAVAQDCLEVAVHPESGRLVATRPVYGGNAMARVTFAGDGPQVAMMRTKAYEPLGADPSRTGDIEPLDVQLDPSLVKARVVETVKRESEGVRLEDASVVVSGGRGLGGSEPFQILEELAQMLGGAIGASRAVCDAGWLDHSYQIGLTGKAITPDLYITVGISGASQHMAGCSGAKHIVAINRDSEANIFKSSSFGVVGDWRNVLPSFVETVRELVKS